MTQRTFEFARPNGVPRPIARSTGALLLDVGVAGVTPGLIAFAGAERYKPGWVELALVIACRRRRVGRHGLAPDDRAWLCCLRPTGPALSRDELYRLTPSQFEEYVAQRLFARQGYTVENA